MFAMGSNPDRTRQALTPAQANHRGMLNRELRAAFIAGAEERSIRDKGRGLSKSELRSILARYSGDLPER
jgi:hypothetical protein